MPVITKEEIISIIQENKIRPKQLFTEEEILDDPVVKGLAKEARETAIKEKKKKEEEESLIPGMNEPDPVDNDNPFIPDDDKSTNDDSDSMIPD